MTSEFNCNFCNSKYKSQSWLNKHIIEKHNGIKCEYCNVKIDKDIIDQHKCTNMKIFELEKQLEVLKLENSRLSGNIQAKDELISTTVSSISNWDVFSGICGSRNKK